MRSSRTALAALLATACLLPLPVGAGERAFRGDEFTPRDWRYSQNYFTDILSYVPDKDWLDRWAQGGSGYLVSAGSFTGQDMYLAQEARIDEEIIPGIRLRYSYTEAEDFDSRYRMSWLEWQQSLGFAGLSVSLLGQMSAEKKNDDAGLALAWTDGPQRLRISALLPDAVYNGKAGGGDVYLDKPFALRLEARLRPVEDLILDLDVGWEMPLELLRNSEQWVGTYERLFYRATLSWNRGTGEQVWLGVEGETAEKSRIGMEGGDPLTWSSDRRSQAVRLEWFFPAGSDRVTLGGRYLSLRENYRYPNDPALTRVASFSEMTLYGGYRWQAWRTVYLEPRIFVTRADDTWEHPYDAGRTRSYQPWQAKAALGLGWELRKNATLLLNPTFDLDETSFGGGNIRLLVLF